MKDTENIQLSSAQAVYLANCLLAGKANYGTGLMADDDEADVEASSFILASRGIDPALPHRAAHIGKETLCSHRGVRATRRRLGLFLQELGAVLAVDNQPEPEAEPAQEAVEAAIDALREMESDAAVDAAVERVKANPPKVMNPLIKPPAPPLIGRWHHGRGVLVCGTVQVAREDFDTNPAEEFKTELLDWICATLNAWQSPQAVWTREPILARVEIKDTDAREAIKRAMSVAPGVEDYRGTGDQFGPYGPQLRLARETIRSIATAARTIIERLTRAPSRGHTFTWPEIKPLADALAIVPYRPSDIGPRKPLRPMHALNPKAFECPQCHRTFDMTTAEIFPTLCPECEAQQP